jgi:hypothetical protein
LYFAFRHGLRAANELRLWLSFGDFVRRHQTDLDDHVAGGRVPEDARRRFDADVERAYPVVLDQQAAPPATRPLDWFERSSSPFLRFETVSAPGRRHRLGLLSATLAPEVMSHAAGLAGAGHLVHVLVPEPGRASTVDFESGVWVHRLEAEDEVFERELARLAEFTPLDAVQIVGGAVDPSRLSAYPLADAAELGVPSALK